MRITGYTVFNPFTGIKTTVSIPAERRHLEVLRHRDGTWYLGWAIATGVGGHRYDYAGLEAERGFRTKREALARKRAIYAERS